MHRTRPQSAAIAWLILVGLACAGPDENDVYVLTAPEHTPEEIAKAYAEMPKVKYQPPADRWDHLPITAAALSKGDRALRIVMLGDSIVNDTSRSRWDDLLRQAYPDRRIDRTTCVRGGTGCWWFKEPSRLKRYVLDLNPDLLIIGGISHKDDVDSIREVIVAVRKARPCDVLLMTGAFGTIDPRVDAQWRPDIDPKGTDYRARLKRLAAEEKAAFLDMTGAWGRYIRDSGKGLDWFKRDPIHANIRGEQILGHILAAHLAPPLPDFSIRSSRTGIVRRRSISRHEPPGGHGDHRRNFLLPQHLRIPTAWAQQLLPRSPDTARNAGQAPGSPIEEPNR